MAVDAIGAALSSQSSSGVVNNSSLSETDLIKLFLTQLQYQDSMDPVDNGQFLAQLAQFATLQSTEDMDSNVQNLVFMNSAAQSLSLLNQPVTMSDTSGNTINGTVTAVQFSTSGPTLSVTASDGSVQTGVQLSQINQVTP